MMRQPRFRFTIRRLMIMVAIMAVALGLVERSQRFRRMAIYHESHTISSRFVYSDGTKDRDGFDNDGDPVTQAMSDWHYAMAVKYYRASRYPWLPLASDPPKPPPPAPEQSESED